MRLCKSDLHEFIPSTTINILNRLTDFLAGERCRTGTQDSVLRNDRTNTASFIGHQVNVDYIMRLCHLWRYSSRVDKKRHYTRARARVDQLATREHMRTQSSDSQTSVMSNKNSRLTVLQIRALR